MTIGAPIAPAPAAIPATASAAGRPPSLEERVADLSVYAESGDPVAEGEIWYVEETAPIFGEDGISFDDFLDVINPLHHIPIVGTLYRAITGDTLASGPRVMGGALFGGVIGFAAALVNAVIDETTGSDIGDKALALFSGDGKTVAGDDDAVAVATAGPETAAPASAPAAAPAAERTATKAAASPPPAAIHASTVDSIPARGGADRGGKPGLAPFANGKSVQTPPNGQVPPSEALIRARSAVPIAHKAAALGFGGAPARTAALNPPPATADIPATGAPPHGGMPGRPVAKPAFPSVVSNRPARYTVGHPSSTSATPDPMPRRAAVQIGATPPNDVGSVPMLMQQALEKYELLMQARRNPTLQDEI